VSYKCINIDGEYYYGKHLMLTAQGCNDTLLSEAAMSDFLITLADKIDMVRYGDPIVARFGEGEQTGISGVQLITTSAITLHTNDKYRDLYLDVFSCKWFTGDTVNTVVTELFSPKNISVSDVLRK
jgi:S-adenosylmethionine/arginine decarboxylase-like enzyme